MNFNKQKRFFISVCFLFLGTVSVHLIASQPDTLRVLLIGNSFSENSTRYLPQMAKEGGHVLILGHAEIGGCSLQKHWDLSQLAESDSTDVKGKPYKGKSLRMMLLSEKWDVVTMQQFSWHSGYFDSYVPYAQNLYSFVKTLQPNARILLQQTWAYRSDSKDFSVVSKDKNGKEKYAKNSKDMWKKSRNAYRKIAKQLDLEIMPVGDAFWKAYSTKKWAYKVDENFDYSNPVYPALPNQANSLNAGYYWDKNKEFRFDSHHANDAGCYLGGLVWYAVLFNQSPTELTFTPESVSADYASFLRGIARATTK